MTRPATIVAALAAGLLACGGSPPKSTTPPPNLDDGAGSGSGSAAGPMACPELMQHVLDLELSNPDLDPKTRDQIAGQKDQILAEATAQCEKQSPPPELVACVSAAKDWAAYDKCSQEAEALEEKQPAVAANGVDCKAFAGHAFDLAIADPSIDDATKSQLEQSRRQLMGQAVEGCMQQPPSPELASCVASATEYPAVSQCIRQFGPKREHPEPKPGTAAPTKDDLALYTKKMKGKGPLVATIATDAGTIHCELFADKAPATVANFIGLATGQKAWWNPATNATETKKPFYDGLTFHRVVPEFMIQGGDPMGDGTGGPGYEFDDELDPSLKHDQPGVLAMANTGPDSNGSQFYITEVATPHLDGNMTIFGQCKDLEVIKKIARTAADAQNKPTTALHIKKITVRRGWGK